jgi:hypothetical protein
MPRSVTEYRGAALAPTEITTKILAERKGRSKHALRM